MRADYDVTYADNRKTVLLKADLDKGWRRLEKTYGFFRQMWIWYGGDLRVRTMLTLLAQPATFHESAKEFPDVALRGGNELTNYEIREKKLLVSVALSQDQPWRLMMGKRPGIFFEELGLNIGQGMYWLDLRAWLVFHPPGRAPIPDVRVWCQKFFVPAGQFESNRRHH
jgi:hypothetical protein